MTSTNGNNVTHPDIDIICTSAILGASENCPKLKILEVWNYSSDSSELQPQNVSAFSQIVPRCAHCSSSIQLMRR